MFTPELTLRNDSRAGLDYCLDACSVNRTPFPACMT
jgi:hypothetical protein